MSRIEIESEVTGSVWKVEAQVGAKLQKEDVIMIIESMKMEIPVESPCAGTLVELRVKEEDAVEEDQILAVIESG